MRNSRAAGKAFLAGSSELWLAAGLLMAGLYFFSGRFTPVRFDQERIQVRVARGRLQVTGLYHYTNPSRLPAVLTLAVPFPVDAAHPRPEFFSLSEADEDGRARTDVLPSLRGEEVRIRLFFRPGEAKWIRLDYDQPARVSRGRYLLTTTRAWRRPIDHAVFTLRLSRGIRLGASNYPLAPLPVSTHEQVYSFSRNHFYPDRDWDFVWEEAPPARAPAGGPR